MTVLSEKYKLANPDWNLDVIPEIMDGKNIADYVDPEIMAKLDMLDEEEDKRVEEMKSQMDDDVRKC